MHLQDSASMGFMGSVCLQPFNLHRTDTALVSSETRTHSSDA